MNQILENNVTYWLLTFSILISIFILRIFSVLVQKKKKKKDYDANEESVKF